MKIAALLLCFVACSHALSWLPSSTMPSGPDRPTWCSQNGPSVKIRGCLRLSCESPGDKWPSLKDYCTRKIVKPASEENLRLLRLRRTTPNYGHGGGTDNDYGHGRGHGWHIDPFPAVTTERPEPPTLATRERSLPPRETTPPPPREETTRQVIHHDSYCMIMHRPQRISGCFERYCEPGADWPSIRCNGKIIKGPSQDNLRWKPGPEDFKLTTPANTWCMRNGPTRKISGCYVLKCRTHTQKWPSVYNDCSGRTVRKPVVDNITWRPPATTTPAREETTREETTPEETTREETTPEETTPDYHGHRGGGTDNDYYHGHHGGGHNGGHHGGGTDNDYYFTSPPPGWNGQSVCHINGRPGPISRCYERICENGQEFPSIRNRCTGQIEERPNRNNVYWTPPQPTTPPAQEDTTPDYHGHHGGGHNGGHHGGGTDNDYFVLTTEESLRTWCSHNGPYTKISSCHQLECKSPRQEWPSVYDFCKKTTVRRPAEDNITWRPPPATTPPAQEDTTPDWRKNQRCRRDPFRYNDCFDKTEFIFMVERMESKLFSHAMKFAKAMVQVSDKQRIPVSLLTFGKTDQSLKCGWFVCTKKDPKALFRDAEELIRNPPDPEVPRLAYALDFGTEFPISRRFGGNQDSRNIIFLIGSGKHDPKEKQADYERVTLKAKRLGVTVVYLEVGPGDEVALDVGIPNEVMATVGFHVVKVSPADLADKNRVWRKTAEFVFPPGKN